MRSEKFINKLFIPLYILFILSILFSSLLSGFFEHFSNMPFEDLARFVRDNSDKILLMMEENPAQEYPSPEFTEASTRLEDEFIKRFGEGETGNTDKMLEKAHPLYVTRNPGLLMLLAVLIWMIPIYRFQFSKNDEPDDKVVNRVLKLPVFIFLLPWAGALWGLILKLGFRASEFQHLSSHITANFVASFIMYGSLAGFLNSWFTSRYINNGIAKRTFTENKLHTLKEGLSMNLTTRILLLVLSLGMIPLLLSIYIPAVFNMWMFKSIAAGEEVDLVITGQILGPLMITAVVNIIFILAQLFSIVSFRKNIQGPINILIERMQKVAKGDFAARTSVLSSDEIGRLKGHFNMMVEGLEEREKLRDTFGKFVSIEIARKLIETQEVDLEGEEIETTVMFADIRNFTALSEGYAPRELIEFLNDYFSYMVQPISQMQGVINKFIGDCIMAVFSPVFGLEAHAESAVRASLLMREALIEFNKPGKYPPIRHGIGVHTGFLIAGNVGSENRKEYTVIGDTVNVASRIESQTKVYETDILISESTYDRLGEDFLQGIRAVKNDPVTVRGKSRPITLYSLEQ